VENLENSQIEFVFNQVDDVVLSSTLQQENPKDLLVVVSARMDGRSSSVPPDNDSRRDNDESLFPSCPESTSGDPEEVVDQCQVWPRMATFRDGVLPAEREIL